VAKNLPEEIHTCYQSTNLQAVAQDHVAFHNAVERAINNPNLKFICFASYGTDKISALGSPVVFPVILDDFKRRTRAEWVRTEGVPDLLRFFLHDALNNHVGYTVRTLYLINESIGTVHDVESLQMLLYSKRLLEYLTTLRGSPSRIDPLPDDERVTLEELILRGAKMT
jgi:hypothetical protein